MTKATTIIIFGATGDLAGTKLFPAFYNLFKKGLLPENFKIIANGRRDFSDESFTEQIKQKVQTSDKLEFDQEVWNKFSNLIEYLQGDVANNNTYTDIANKVNDLDKEYQTCANKLFYLAVTPNLFETLFEGIKHTHMHQLCQDDKNIRVIIEKPFGRDLNSFQKLNNSLLDLFSEDQIYRIDHVLGKATVENIMYFRKGNPALTCGIKPENVKSLEIHYFETKGVGSRAGYYDEFGQLKDMVQSHMLQLAALMLMDIPKTMDFKNLSKAKTNFIKSLEIKNIKKDVTRGQYGEGVVNGEKSVSYIHEDGVPDASRTETFVKIKAHVKEGKWKGIPLIFTTGKRLDKKCTEIVINYKDSTDDDEYTSNKLVIKIQPNEGIVLHLLVKNPQSDKYQEVEMSFKYKESFQIVIPDAYEKILLDIVRNKDAYAISTQELEASWKFLENILDYWQETNDLVIYPAGSNIMNI